MKKLKLDLEHVAVESFPTSAIPAERGTVAGRATGQCQPSNGGGLDGCTIDGCSDNGTCSWNQYCSVDFCTHECTGYPGCSHDANCSRLDRCTGLTVCYWTP